MKKIFTPLFAAFGFINANAQAILNEVYPLPGNGSNEFFEFYNNSSTPTSMDNYTLISYFEENPDKGFYVMDVPALTVAAWGYFVGSSARPFSYQGVSNSTNSQFSWNDIAFMAANNGYLKKWVVGNTIPAAIDGNANYDLAPLPVNFNDFFDKIGGGGATYNLFVYNNGMLQSIFLGGTGGATFLPSSILSLPSLYIDMTASSPDFTINFSNYTNVNPEYVTQDVGTDNGFIRTRDGFCGFWDKSSQGISHSPGVTNGMGSQTVIPEISVMAAVVRGNAIGGSTVNYDVVAGPTNEFPVTLHIYVDNGTVPGQLDAGDTFVEDKVENTLSDGPFSTIFFPYTANIIIQTTTSAGCIDNVRFLPNLSVLPIRLVAFQGTNTEKSNLLKWTVSENESGKLFEIERSSDGRNFSYAGFINASTRTGTENYNFTDNSTSPGAYYRIKLVDKMDQSFYSTVIFLQNKSVTNSPISIARNPVESYLSFTFSTSSGSLATINIYNIAGNKVYSQKSTLSKGTNNITVATDGKLYPGAYVLEVINDTENTRTKFIKH